MHVDGGISLDERFSIYGMFRQETYYKDQDYVAMDYRIKIMKNQSRNCLDHWIM